MPFQACYTPCPVSLSDKLGVHKEMVFLGCVIIFPLITKAVERRQHSYERRETLYSVSYGRTNFSARPPVVVSGLPNITPIFSRTWLMKIAIVFVLLIVPDSLRNACDIKRA